MNLAILHYHLNRGGVTRVIENQLGALDAVLDGQSPWEVALLYGGRRQGWKEQLPATLPRLRVSLHKVPALDYDEEGGSDELGTQLAATLRQIGFPPHQSVLHVHNHSLGKNVHLPGALAHLAAEGFALLLQVHDFPEDFRPANYRRLREALAPRAAGQQAHAELGAVLYPQGPNVHYAVLNGRDHDILRSAGVAAGRLHLLPNPVPQPGGLPPTAAARQRLAERFGIGQDRRMMLYPVRCIRRKNVGETLLYAALAPPEVVIGLTLPPLNPAEVAGYERWKRLAAELGLPCVFELGAPGGLSFAENLAAAELICTTSLAEGFGMVFLESWLAGRPLLGRDLPEVTRDFAQQGIRLDWLRPQLRVPIDWVGADAFGRAMLDAYRRTLEAYGQDEPDDLPALLAARTADGLVDFGDLDEALQAEVLRIVAANPGHRRRVLHCNPWIEQATSIRRDEVGGPIEANAQAVRQHYGQAASGRRLLDLYRNVEASPRSAAPNRPADAAHLLRRFLSFGRFRPIRGL